MLDVSYGSVSAVLVVLLLLVKSVNVDAIKYRIKFFIIIVTCLAASAWPLPLMLTRPGDWRNARIPARQLSWAMKLLGVKFLVRGEENIVRDSGAVVVINHQGGLDIGVLAELWRVVDNCRLVARVDEKLLRYSVYIRLVGVLCGTIFITQSGGAEAQDAINSSIGDITKKKSKLIVFPEGTRHSEDTLRDFKKGAFRVAIAAQVPVQPVVVSKYHFLNHSLKKFNSGTSYVTILPAISTEGMDRRNLERLMSKTRELMNREFQMTSWEVLDDPKTN